MPGQAMPDAATVEAARAGDTRALDALVGAYLPLVYNIVGRALDTPSEIDDLTQEIMLRMVRDLRQVRDPEAFRSWLLAIAMRQIRGYWREHSSGPVTVALEEVALADPASDLADLTITKLGLSDQRREVAAATRWLAPQDRNLLALWWLEVAGQLTRTELAAALDSSAAGVAVLVHRTKARLDTARAVVRALEAKPRCGRLDAMCARWDGRPDGVWRKRITRHVRECAECGALRADLVPAEKLLAALGTLPLPPALRTIVTSPSAAAHAVTAHGGTPRFGLAVQRAVHGIARHVPLVSRWTNMPGGPKAAVAVGSALALAAGAAGVAHLASRPNPTTGARASAAASASVNPAASAADPGLSSGSSPTPTTIQPAAIVNTPLPVRAAFYYPWFPENFASVGASPGSHYTPTAGDYSVDDASTIDRQIEDMQYGGLNAGIVSWWGQGRREDNRMPALMAEAAKLGFSWSAYYEEQGYSPASQPSLRQITDDLNYLNRYSGQRAWLHIGGRPVIFVYGDAAVNCATVTRWVQASQATHYYVVLKVFRGYRSCADQPQGWHQYDDVLDIQAGHSAVASPGFWKNDEANPRIPRDPVRFRQDVTAVATSGAPFQLIVSYNEWGEGTSAESGTAWPSSSGHGVYMDILHQVFAQHPPKT